MEIDYGIYEIRFNISILNRIGNRSLVVMSKIVYMDWKRSCYDVVKQQFNDKKSDELRSSCGIHFIRDQPPDPRADPGNFGGV